MSGPKPELAARDAEDDEEADAAGEGATASISELAERGDLEGLLALAKAHRAGTAALPRDLGKCFEAYKAAAALGSAAAEHAVALFLLAGGPVPRDEREAAARLRSAADRGHNPAKVYLANLYELGIHYKADPAKADVWYRNAARSSGITAEPGTPEHVRAMAELGCVRYCLEIAGAKDATDEDRAHFTRKAKAYGWRDAARRDSRADRGPGEGGARGDRSSAVPGPAVAPEGLDAVEIEAAVESARGASSTDSKSSARASAKEKPEASKPAATPSRFEWGVGLTAFLYAAVFMAAALTGGHLLTQGAGLLVAEGTPVPVVGEKVHLIQPLVFGVVGVLPTLLVYRLAALGRAIVVGAIAGAAGAFLWGFPSTTLLEPRLVQVIAFGAAGFLAALLVLGVLGGAKSGQHRRRPRI